MIETYESLGNTRTSQMLACSLCGAIVIALVAPNAMADNGPERARRQAAKMSYLDNGVIRLGVDLNLGGAITYLSRSGTGQNLVNSYDCGRQIQMSRVRPRPLWRCRKAAQAGVAFDRWESDPGRRLVWQLNETTGTQQ